MIFYKYRNFSNEQAKQYTEDIVLNKRLYFAGIQSFNDPFDGMVSIDTNGTFHQIRSAQTRVQYAEKLLNDGMNEGIRLEKAQDLVYRKFTPEFIEDRRNPKSKLFNVQQKHNAKGVLSLSAHNDSILMWSHYSFNHNGICLGFDLENIGLYSKIKRVRYQTHYEHIWAWLHTDDEIVDKILFSKSSCWQYEDEYRVIRDSVGFESYPPEALREVVFGSKMSYENKIEFKDLCENNGLFPEFLEAELDVKQYKLNISKFGI